MKNKKAKITFFTVMLIAMVTFIIWMMYMSEPQYINNNYKVPEKYDLVSMPNGLPNEVAIGLVLQVDSNSATFKETDFIITHHYQLDLHHPETFRVIGRGTFYHKVNSYIGFNIMFMTVSILTIISIIILRALLLCLFDFFGVTAWQF